MKKEIDKKLELISAVVAASMLSSVSFASLPQDVTGTDIETQATVLGALEIMVGDADTGAFRPNDAIKRSEVAKVGVALMGLSKVADSSSDVSFYPDVDKDHWANGFINVASAQKLVIGDDVGTFRPDDQIKYSEAVTIITRALGYEPQALAKGGFPTGYMATANSIGLTKGLSGSADKLISRADIAKLAYNALTINLMEQTGFGTNVSYEVTDKTLLEDKLNTTLVTGKVQAVGTSVMGSSAALSKNEINIGGKIYNTGSADVRNVLGFTVDAYLAKDGKTLKAVVPSEGKNNSVTVGADSIAKVENSGSNMALHYYADGEVRQKTIKAPLTQDAQVIYNGKAASNDKFTAIESGTITLLDSDGDSKYDTAFVNETVNYVVDQVYSASDKITDKYNMGTLELDFEDESKTVVLEKGGVKATLDDLKQWDVITVTKSEDSELIYAEAVHIAIEGKISEKDNEHVYIGGKKYKVAANYPSALTLGTEGTFYLDCEGKIAAFDGKTAKSSNYAYLEAAALTGGMDKTLSLKLF
ncbi:MAG: S-layer homology domain-containing protein, partial [Clostridia bacterium]|nr:S-layer homology domain-containing protein [Clostridia bacterium]